MEDNKITYRVGFEKMPCKNKTEAISYIEEIFNNTNKKVIELWAYRTEVRPYRGSFLTNLSRLLSLACVRICSVFSRSND